MKLNEYTDKTKENIHLLVTPLCDRNCKHCCNKQYDLNEIPFVTDEELRNAKTLYLTGGEPFAYSNPDGIAWWYKRHYPNIEKVIVYTNAYEFLDYMDRCGYLSGIDGLDISIKSSYDYDAMIRIIDECKDNVHFMDNIMPNSRIYNFLPCASLSVVEKSGAKVVNRYWQKDFTPADDSIFRRM